MVLNGALTTGVALFETINDSPVELLDLGSCELGIE